MKYICLIFLLALQGCSQLMSGQIQPVVLKKEGVYFTTCSGAVENHASCHNKAIATCVNGYIILDKFQDTQGAHRSLTFECKK